MLFSFAIMTAFIPGVIGLTSNTAWAVMWLVTPILLLNCKIGLTPINILGAVFLSYATLSLLWSPHGLLELMQLLVLASVFVWGLSLTNLKNVTVGLSLGLAVSSVIAILQYFRFELPIITVSKASGLFINANVYTEASGLILILILINRLWWFVPTTFIGLAGSSRAVVLGLGLALMAYAWSKSKLLALIFAVASCTGAFSLNSSLDSVNVRLNIWLDMLAGFKFFGNGIGSFIYLFPEYNKHLDTAVDLAEYAHNDWLHLIFELGIGAIPFILIVIILLKVNSEYKNALIFFIVIGCFGFPLHMPITGFIVALVAAQLAKLSLGDRTAINSSRSILFDRMETIKC